MTTTTTTMRVPIFMEMTATDQPRNDKMTTLIVFSGFKIWDEAKKIERSVLEVKRSEQYISSYFSKL
jgi:hypothetical protein